MALARACRTLGGTEMVRLLNERVNLPNWAITVIVGLILNMVMVAFSAGMIVNRIDGLTKQFDYLENRFYDHLKEQHNLRGLK